MNGFVRPSGVPAVSQPLDPRLDRLEAAADPVPLVRRLARPVEAHDDRAETGREDALDVLLSRKVEFVLTRTRMLRSSAYRIMSKISGFRNGSPKFHSAIILRVAHDVVDDVAVGVLLHVDARPVHVGRHRAQRALEIALRGGLDHEHLGIEPAGVRHPAQRPERPWPRASPSGSRSSSLLRPLAGASPAGVRPRDAPGSRRSEADRTYGPPLRAAGRDAACPEARAPSPPAADRCAAGRIVSRRRRRESCDARRPL